MSLTIVPKVMLLAMHLFLVAIAIHEHGEPLKGKELNAKPVILFVAIHNVLLFLGGWFKP